jgi:uncharacterized membrane protein (UPF0136 family)
MQIITLGFAAFVLAGGVAGYKKKGSRDSLIASSIIAGLLAVAGVMMGNPSNTYSIRLALVTTLALGFYMGRGFLRTRKVFPQLVLGLTSLLLSVGYMGALAA